MRDDSAEILFQPFLRGGHREQFWHGQGRPLFDVVHPELPSPTTASPTLQGSLKDGFEQAVVALDTAEKTRKVSSYYSGHSVLSASEK